MTSTPPRVVVVLGYSDGGCDVLHPVGAARLARAAEVSTEEDVVVLSGWARVAGTRSEAELMAAAWKGQAARAGSRPGCANDGRQRLQRPERRQARRRTRGRGGDLALPRTAGTGGVPAPARSPTDPGHVRVPARAAQPSRVPRRAAALAPAAGSAVACEAHPAGAGRGGLRPGPDDRLKPVAASSPRRGSGSSTRAEGPRRAPPARRGSRRGSRAPSPPACRRRCRGRTGP